MIRLWLYGLRQGQALVLAWAIIASPLVLSVLALGILAFDLAAKSAEVSTVRRQVDALAERIGSAERDLATWFDDAARSPAEIAGYSDFSGSREAFEAEYDRFLAVVDAAGLETRRAGAVREAEVQSTIGEFQASWVGRGRLEDLLAALIAFQPSDLRVSSFTIRGAESAEEGVVDAVIEFRRAVLLGSSQ
jgi:hypothetical protein